MEDSKKKRILDAATKVIAENGYQYATISAIAKEAGMSTGLIYSYFENKLDLLFSIVMLFLQNINRLNRQGWLSWMIHLKRCTWWWTILSRYWRRMRRRYTE